MNWQIPQNNDKPAVPTNGRIRTTAPTNYSLWHCRSSLFIQNSIAVTWDGFNSGPPRTQLPDITSLPRVSIVVPFFGLTKYIIRIL